MTSAFAFQLGETSHALRVVARRPQLIVEVDGKQYTVAETDEGLVINGRPYRLSRALEGNAVHVKLDHQTWLVGYQDPIAAAQQEAGGDDELRADMPGVVVSVNVAAGETVASGDTLLVIESMKMQISVVAPRDGVVETIHVTPNETFDKGATLVSMAGND